MLPLAIAPLGLDSAWVSVLLGVAFGATLERSGFGDARRLAAQFYLTEMRVLKVMFTAIVTALVLLTLAATAGWLDFGALAVNPTWIGTAVLGGLLLGVGFVVGGYCPGTSIVSASTGKVDGLMFVGGVGLGVFAFGETGGLFRTFYDNAGYLGRVTLPDVLGLPFGVTVALVVAMALGMFVGATALERRFGPGAPAAPRRAPPLPGGRWLRAGAAAALVVALAAVARPASGAGSVEERVRLLDGEMSAVLASRSVHVDPLEALGLLHQEIDGQPARFPLNLLDLRPEADFNRFHLVDARPTTLERLRGADGRAIADPRAGASITLLLSNDEAVAEQGWRILRAEGARNLYVLEGGVNLWLDVFRNERPDNRRQTCSKVDETLRHAFPSSLGDRYPFARPSAAQYRTLRASGARPYVTKVRPVTTAPRRTGGCG
jgi:hypothetical protein